jgi:hypothetical protein
MGQQVGLTVAFAAAGPTRRNESINPKSKNTITGWTGGSTPVQSTGLTGSGLPANVTTGARYTAGTFMQTATGLAVPGTTYTGSFYIREGGPAGGTGLGLGASTLYLVFIRSVGGLDETHTASISAQPTNTWVRLSLANITAPANTTGIMMYLDSNNFSVRPCDVTALLLEPVASLNSYFDGDYPGAAWTGTNGDSASTL